MVSKRIVWSPAAIEDRSKILKYWYRRLGNKKYSYKLGQDFAKIIQLLSKSPYLGRFIEGRKEQSFTKDNYRIYYRIKDDEIIILRIWDTRRDPETFDFNGDISE